MSSGRHEALTVEADEIRLRYLKAEIELGLKFARISMVENDLDFVSANRLKQAAVRA
jgi:hypothetical protein